MLSPGGPNNQGFPSSAISNGGSTEGNHKGGIIDNNHLHVNPYPNVSGPGQAQVCEAGRTAFVPGEAVIGPAPAKEVSAGTEYTKRTTNLFGETYPASTLKALGESK